MSPLPELTDVDCDRFNAEVRPAALPVILRGLGAGWPAVRAARQSPKAGVDYLRRFSHAEPVLTIVGPPAIEGRFGYTPDLKGLNFTRGQSPLHLILDRLLRDQAAKQPFAMAVQSIPLPDLLPGFTAENATDLLPAAVVPRMWLGNAVRVATHYDQMENLGVVVMGRRRFTLFPPDQISNLYLGPLEHTPAGTPISLVDPHRPDLDRFPRFSSALEVAQQGTLEPGDAIYIPFHWWHAVDSLNTVNAFVNYWWNPAPPGMGDPYDALLHALMAIGSLPDDQRRAYRAVFDHLVFRTDGDPAEHLPREVRGALGDADPEIAARLRAQFKRKLPH